MIWKPHFILIRDQKKTPFNHPYRDPKALYPYYEYKLMGAALRGSVATIHHLTMLLVFVCYICYSPHYSCLFHGAGDPSVACGGAQAR